MRHTILFVDDETDKGAHYCQRLETSGLVKCRLLAPPRLKDLVKKVGEPPGLFLVDYELRLAQSEDMQVAYQGLTLAAQIRMEWPDIPIVLITRPTILQDLDAAKRRHLEVGGQSPAFDELITKARLDEDLEKTLSLLVSIASGFRELTNLQKKDWKALFEAMGANAEEESLLREAAPPLEKGQWTVAEAANWIRSIVLRYPGIVYDPVNAATRLGLALKSFQDKRVQELLDEACYKGVFAPAEGRWWRDRLFGCAIRLMREAELLGPVNRAYSEALRKVRRFAASPAVCIWDGTPLADWVCCLRHQPVKMANSLRYNPDRRPGGMYHARVSFRAIREDDDFDASLLDSEAQARLSEIDDLKDPLDP